MTVPTALGAPRFPQRTAVTIPDTVAVVTIAIKAARMTGVMDAVRSLTSKVRPLGVVRIEFQEQKIVSRLPQDHGLPENQLQPFREARDRVRPEMGGRGGRTGIIRWIC
jgi:hypothetical protein